MKHPMRMAGLLAACIAIAPVSAASAATTEDGMLAFNNHCRQCHTYKKGDNRLGPSLYGVVGRKAGTEPNYGGYSESMKAAGFTWTPELLDKWITKPESVVPGNNMAPPFPGLEDKAQRQAIITFLQHDTELSKPQSATH